MDRRLKDAADGIASLFREVREGTFPETPASGKGRTWEHGGLVFADEVPGPEESAPGGDGVRFTIVTPYAGAAGSLLDRIHELFGPLLDLSIEHDFFDRVGEAALEYSGYADRSDQTAVNLLKILLNEAESILDEMREGEFPYAARGEMHRQGEAGGKEEEQC